MQLSHRQCKNPTDSLLPLQPSTTRQQVMQSRDAAGPLWEEEELPDLYPICLLLCQTTQLQGSAIHFLTPPSSKHLSITNLNCSHSVLWMRSKNKPVLIYLNCLAHISCKTYTESQKAFFAQRQNVLWSLHTFNPERMTLLRVYSKHDRKPSCHHPGQPGTPYGQQSSSATLRPGVCPLCCIHPLLQDK